MNIIESSGKKTIKMSQKEWESIGKKAGWMKQSSVDYAKFDSYMKSIVERNEKENAGETYAGAFGTLTVVLSNLMSDIEGALNGSTLINSTSKALGAEDILKKALELSKNKTEEDNNDIIGNK
jgi:hypothetical protein